MPKALRSISHGLSMSMLDGHVGSAQATDEPPDTEGLDDCIQPRPAHTVLDPRNGVRGRQSQAGSHGVAGDRIFVCCYLLVALSFLADNPLY